MYGLLLIFLSSSEPTYKKRVGLGIDKILAYRLQNLGRITTNSVVNELVLMNVVQTPGDILAFRKIRGVRKLLGEVSRRG